MKNPNHRDRLIASLPADLQAGAMEACHKISEDANDPVVGMFATDIESTQRGFAVQRENTQQSTAQLREEIQSLRAKLAESDERHRGEIAQATDREKKLMAEIAKGHTETQKTIQCAISALIGIRLWRRVNITQLSGACIWLAVMIGSNHIIQNKMWTLNPKQVEGIQAKIDEQIQFNTKNFEILTNNQKNVVEYVKSVSETNATTACETLIGKGMLLYLKNVNNDYLTLSYPTVKTGTVQDVTIKHYLTPLEIAQLNVAISAAKRVR